MSNINLYSSEYLDGLLQRLSYHFFEAYEHSYHVAELAGAIAFECHMSKEDISKVYLCGLIHDVGKIHIPKDILSKKGKLTAEEYEIIKTHSREGFLLINKHVSEDIAYGVLMHHERLDGTGYPLQVRDDEIPPYAKIIMVADAYEAMSVKRVYHSALSWKEALDELRNEPAGYDAFYVEALEKAILQKNALSVQKSG